jgi:hypothetical protein
MAIALQVDSQSLELPLPLSPWRRRAAMFGLWTLLGVFFGMKQYFDVAPFGGNLRLTKALWWHMMEWYAWAVCSPGIFWICRSFHRWSWPRYLFVQFGAAVTLSTAQVGICSVGALIEAWCYNWPRTQVGDPFSWRTVFEYSLINHIHFNVFTYAVIAGAWHLAHYYGRFREREVRTAELEASLNCAQLQMLRAQLQPHFLFNTLNIIAELIHQDPTKAEKMVLRLSELLRITLKREAEQEAPLSAEIEAIRSYIEIEQARLGNRLQVKIDIAPDTLNARVPNLILQPLVENAIRYGVAPRAAQGEIRIGSRRENGALRLVVRDNGPGLPVTPRANAGNGIGLSNTRARLKRLYGEHQRMDIFNDGGLVVSLEMPFVTDCNAKAADTAIP